MRVERYDDESSGARIQVDSRRWLVYRIKVYGNVGKRVLYFFGVDSSVEHNCLTLEEPHAFLELCSDNQPCPTSEFRLDVSLASDRQCICRHVSG